MEPLPLRPYQIQDLAHYMKHWRFMNLSCPAVGKTPSVCVRLYQLHSEFGVKSIWTMPSSLMLKNKVELHRFTRLTDKQVVILGGQPLGERKKLIESKDAVVFIHTFKGFANDLERLLSSQPDLGFAAVDEWHLGYKTVDSERTRALIKFCERKKAGLLVMTGTLVDGLLSSIYPAIHLIEPRYYAGSRGFEQEHAVYDFDNKIVGWTKLWKIQEILKKHSIRRTFDSVYGAESKQIFLEYVELDGPLKKLYDELETTALIELEDTVAGHGLNTSAKLLRCRQLLSHPHYYPIHASDEAGKPEYRDLMKGCLTQKEQALLIHVENFKQRGEPFIVYGVYVPELKRIHQLITKAGVNAGLIHGGIPSGERDRIDRAFRSGECDCIVGSPATAAVGFNWQFSGDREVSNMLFMSMDYLDSTFIQAIRRAIRGKRASNLLIRVIACKNTMDFRVFQIVLEKSLLANRVDPTRQVFDFKTMEPVVTG